MKHTAKWFIQRVRDRAEAFPSSPIRFDTTRDNVKEVSKALRSLPDEWCCTTAEHLDSEKRDRGIVRVAFFGPNCPEPSPLAIVDVKLPEDPDKSRAAFKRAADDLRKKYGPDYCIEPRRHRNEDDDRLPTRPVCEVWLGSDYLASPSFLVTGECIA